jgi:hypothetical protein
MIKIRMVLSGLVCMHKAGNADVAPETLVTSTNIPTQVASTATTRVRCFMFLAARIGVLEDVTRAHAVR